ncbi:hypothetical protein ACH5RR_014493 [Cinchona calisaya]|uniref:Uncharacterized protein n=1 Tax=Cinchona calisaya TaxID=153742 RepID=A0ABD3A5D6_9GENT
MPASLTAPHDCLGGWWMALIPIYMNLGRTYLKSLLRWKSPKSYKPHIGISYFQSEIQIAYLAISFVIGSERSSPAGKSRVPKLHGYYYFYFVDPGKTPNYLFGNNFVDLGFCDYGSH